MPTNYSGTPADRAAITVPDGSDKPSGSLFSTPLEQIWDQILYEKAALADQVTLSNRLRFARACSAVVSGTSVPNNGYLTIETPSMNLPGPPGNTGFGVFAISGGGASLAFPTDPRGDDYRGVYLVNVDVIAQVDTAGEPVSMLLGAYLSDSGSDTLIAYIIGRRFSSSTASSFSAHASFPINLTGLVRSQSQLRIRNHSPDALTVSDVYSRVTATWQGDGVP